MLEFITQRTSYLIKTDGRFQRGGFEIRQHFDKAWNKLNVGKYWFPLRNIKKKN